MRPPVTTLFGIVAVSLLAALLTGCPNGQSTSGAPSAATPRPAPPAPTPATDGMADVEIGNGRNSDGDYVCPVMGSTLTELSDELAVEHEGKTYYFCCAGCPEAFEKGPAKYIAAIEAGQGSEGTEATDTGGAEAEHDHSEHDHTGHGHG